MSTTITEPATDPQPAPPPADATGNPNGGNGATPAEPEVYKTKEDFQRALARSTQDIKNSKELRDEIRAEIERENRQKTQEEQGEFKPLWETAETERKRLEDELATLKPVSERLERAEAIIATLAEQALEGAPEYVVDLLKDKDALERLEFANAHRDKWSTDQRRGIPATPRGQAMTRDALIDQEERALRASGRYSL